MSAAAGAAVLAAYAAQEDGGNVSGGTIALGLLLGFAIGGLVLLLAWWATR